MASRAVPREHVLTGMVYEYLYVTRRTPIRPGHRELLSPLASLNMRRRAKDADANRFFVCPTCSHYVIASLDMQTLVCRPAATHLYDQASVSLKALGGGMCSRQSISFFVFAWRLPSGRG